MVYITKELKYLGQKLNMLTTFNGTTESQCQDGFV